MNRHPAGFYYSQAFVGFLEQRQAAEAAAHPGQILAMDYLRCRDGERQGEEWWQMDWIPFHSVPAEAVLDIGGVSLAVSKASRRGLKGRLLHHAGGQVLVRS